LTQLVIDANVLGDVCRDEDNAREVLDIVRERKLTVIFCKEISNEYTPLFKHPDCKGHKKILQDWYTLMREKFGKKVKIEGGTVNRCFSDLIKRKRFTEKDIVYVKAAKKIKGDDKILIAYEWHFQNADSCIEQLGIRRLDLDCAVEFLNAM
jgi:predicted nucleic acid-binding protein